MGPFKIFQCMLVAVLISIGLTHASRDFIDNLQVATIAKVENINPMFVMPLKYNQWHLVDASIYLKPIKNESGKYTCMHVTPVAPKYQTITTLTNGQRICCDIKGKNLLIPIIKDSGSYYFYCGNYPEQQVVSLPVSYVNKIRSIM